jgi:tRNA A37 methylthiotransferase MiaB
MESVFIYSLDACERRVLDANRISKYLSENNYKIVNNPTDADKIIFISCSAIDKMTEKSLDLIKKFQKYDAELIVGGCLPAIDKEELSTVFNGKTIITKDLDQLDLLFPENEIKCSSIKDANVLYPNLNKDKPLILLKNCIGKITTIRNMYIETKDYILKNLFGQKSLLYKWFQTKNPIFYIRISWGCLGNCSYCGIKKAIGTHKSKPLEQCISEFKNGLKAGYKNFVLTADDTGAYGIDKNNTLPELLDKITKIPGNYKISIQSLHPRWVVRYIDDLEKIIRRKKIIHIDIPIQSGSSRILKLMHRYSNIEEMKNAFQRLKKSYPNVLLITDYIIGFPTETVEDYEQTLNFINDNYFTGFIIPFSCKKGSKAEKIKPNISSQEVSRRVKFAKNYLRKKGYNVYVSGYTFLFDKEPSIKE